MTNRKNCVGRGGIKELLAAQQLQKLKAVLKIKYFYPGVMDL